MILHWCAENPSVFHSFFSPPLCSFPSQSSSVRRRRRRSHPQSTHNLSQLLTQQLQQLQWTKPMSAFRPPSSCFPLQLNFCSQNAERTSLSWSWSVSVSGLLGPPQAPKKIGFSKTSLLMSCKHTLSPIFFFFADLFSCETEQQQQQRQQQQKLNFFEKIDGKSLSQFPPQFPKTKKKKRKRNKLAKSLRRSRH
jgi:hypothetical protein